VSEHVYAVSEIVGSSGEVDYFQVTLKLGFRMED
jgi:flavin-binding protein dodecin